MGAAGVGSGAAQAEAEATQSGCEEAEENGVRVNFPSIVFTCSEIADGKLHSDPIFYPFFSARLCCARPNQIPNIAQASASGTTTPTSPPNAMPRRPSTPSTCAPTTSPLR